VSDGETRAPLIGRSASGSVVHIESGGLERRRALCGARIVLAAGWGERATCPPCLRKAAAYGLSEATQATSGTGA
jgi:hypothetical protein